MICLCQNLGMIYCLFFSRSCSFRMEILFCAVLKSFSSFDEIKYCFSCLVFGIKLFLLADRYFTLAIDTSNSVNGMLEKVPGDSGHAEISGNNI